MKDINRTKAELVRELSTLRQQISVLQSEDPHGRLGRAKADSTDVDPLGTVLDNLPIGIAYLDKKYRFLRTNKFFNRLAGVGEEVLIGKRCYDTIGEYAEDSTKQGAQRICSFCRKDECFEQKTPMVIHRRLGARFVKVTTIPELDEKGNLRRFVELFEDVHERKRFQDTLLDSERKFRRLTHEFHSILDAIPDSLLLLSSDLRVLWANRGAAVTLDRTVSELIGQACYDLWGHSSRLCRNCHAKKSFRTGQIYDAQFSTRNGRMLDASSFPIRNEQGKVTEVIMLYRDITDKMTLQAETLRAGHLASLGELAAGVAHEINNPTNGIINYAQILADKSVTETREHDLALEIISEGRRIARIVKSLLSFARDRKEEKSAVQVSRSFSDILSLMERLIQKNGIRFELSLSPGLPPVHANPQQIQQVFLNIINNALYALNQKYPGAHENKVLQVSGEKHLASGRAYVRVTFLDRGTGIAPQILDKLVHPFFSTKPSGQGTGLGLSISHGIVTDHGGRLMFESREGEYTKVNVDLPVHC